MNVRDDAELFGLMRAELFTAVIGDVLDTIGLVHQFLPPNIRPLREDMVVTTNCWKRSAAGSSAFGRKQRKAGEYIQQNTR